MSEINPWISHSGGPCPVDGDVRVDVRHKDGDTTMNAHAGDMVVPDPHGFDWWRHYDANGTDEGFVVAYRIVKED